MSLAGLDLASVLLHFGLFGTAMVVLYILRVRRRTVFVPFSPLWTKVLEQQKAASLFRRLQRVGSLLLQLILLVLVILALGDPRLDGESGPGCRHQAPPPTEVSRTLVLIDTSASMDTVEDGRTRLETAIMRVRTQLGVDSANAGRRVMISSFDDKALPLTPWTSDPAVVEGALARLLEAPVRDIGTSFPNALSFAREMIDAVSESKGKQEVIVISDFAFDPESDVSDVDWVPMPVGLLGDNIGIESFNVRPLPDDPLTYIAWYSLRNTLDRPVRADLFVYANPTGRSDVDFLRGGDLVETVPVELAPNAATTGRLETLKFQGDRLMVRVVAQPETGIRDMFVRDDIAFAVVPERRRLRIQLVTAGNAFLKAALETRENVILTETAPENYDGHRNHDVIVLDGVPMKPGDRGRFLLFQPPDVPSTAVVAEVPTTITDKRHPIAKGLVAVDWNVRDMPLHSVDGQDRVIISGPNKEPVVRVRDDVNGSRLVIVAFDLRKSLLPMNVAFPIFIVNSLNFLADEADGFLLPTATGPQVVVPLAFEASSIEVVGPGGPVSGARLTGRQARLELARAGIYEFKGERRLLDGTIEELRHTVAANLNAPAESRIAPRPPASPSQPAPNTTDVAATDAMNPAPSRPLWQLLLLVFIGLVVFEQLTWHRRWTV